MDQIGSGPDLHRFADIADFHDGSNGVLLTWVDLNPCVGGFLEAIHCDLDSIGPGRKLRDQKDTFAVREGLLLLAGPFVDKKNRSTRDHTAVLISRGSRQSP